MTFSSEEAKGINGRRDRSYSDAHALFPSHTNSSSRIHDTPDLKMGATDAITNNNKAITLSNNDNNNMTSTKKLGNNRPRSKSCDLHRLHKKKYPHQYPHYQHKHIPRTHSPKGGAHHVGGGGRTSPPSFSSPKLKGHLWIRPDATMARNQHQQHCHQTPFIPVLADNNGVTGTGHSASNKEHQQKQKVDDNDGEFGNELFATISFPVSDAPARTRQVSSSPTSFGDGMMLYTLPTTATGSFDSSQQVTHGGRARIAFGESGKPIQPRSSFDQYYAPSAAVL